MKILRETTNKDGSHTVTLRLATNEKVKIISSDYHYKLGGQVDDVMGSHVLEEAYPVYWCSITQEWISA